MSATPLKDAWEKYRAMVVPKDASAAQVSETRKAFVSGWCALYADVMENTGRSDEEAMTFMGCVDSEVRVELLAARQRAQAAKIRSN